MSSPQASTPTSYTPVVDASEPNETSLNIRATKRKLDDAFQVLDDAVGSSDTSDRPSPAKRTHTIRSLYSTLAKYGIKSKDSRRSSTAVASSDFETLSKSTPHLTAILTRAATRTRKALPFKFANPSTRPAPPLPPTAEYRPSSIAAFLSRLETYKLATYANKPPAIDAVAASKCGWINDGKDRLVCGLCNNSWVVAGRNGMSRDAGNALIEKQRASLVEMHKDGCPWKTRQCDPSIYHIPLKPPAAMVRDIKTTAIVLEPVLRGVEIKHPLTSSQLDSLRSTISSFALPSPPQPESADSEHGNPNVFTPPPEPSVEVSDTAILTSLFGWTLVPPTAPEPSRRGSLSRASSLAPSVPPTPSISRASSVLYQRPTTTSSTIPNTDFTFRMPSNVFSKRDASLLCCTLCQRRVGLWAFAPQPTARILGSQSPTQNDSNNNLSAGELPSSTGLLSQPKRTVHPRQFGLLTEHRSYCPYVVRSTVVPAPPAPLPTTPMDGHSRSTSSVSQLRGQSVNGSALEGWRAILTVVLRYGSGQRKRLGLDYLERNSGDVNGDHAAEPMEVDGVKAMVAGVKSRGGKDLLKYVKGLLG